MDEYGKDFAAYVVHKVRNETERLKQKHGASTEAHNSQGLLPPASYAVLAPDKGRKVVFDNFDFKQHVHNMTENHQNMKMTRG